MVKDRIDFVLEDWEDERPELGTGALGIVLRIQFVEKILAERLSSSLEGLHIEWFEYDVLSSLRRQGEPFRMTASEIAEQTLLSPGALTNRIDKLIDRKLVTRAEDPEDRRRVLISLTRKGMQLVDKATEERIRCAEEAVAHLSLPQQKQLSSLLRKMLAAIQD